LGLAVALIVGAFVVSASGAATSKTQTSSKINVSTRAAVIHYLRSIHVSTKHVVIQRGLRNYAGAHCPGKGWTCASTRHTVVQIAKRNGQNRYACTTAKCAVVQLGAAYRAPVKAASRPPAPPMNTASCVKTTGVTQSCVINQPNATGTNQAVVWMVTPKDTGLTQSSSYTASITQGPASAPGSSNNNVACVKQFVWLDASTTKTNSAGVVVTNDNHESITISQNSLTGTNTVKGATQSGNTYGCDAAGSQMTQDELLTSIVNTKGGSVTQNQDTSTTNPQGVHAANVVTDIEQNQGGGFFGVAGQGFGVGTPQNVAGFEQSTKQVAIANTSGGTVTQQQNASVPNPPYSGIVGTINQDSKAQSTASVTQNETQCQDAVNVAPIAAPTTTSNVPACPVVPEHAPPANVTVNQTQYGPESVGGPSTSHAGRVPYYHKGYGQSQQTNAGAGVTDTFGLTQHSSQSQDFPGGNVHTLQTNTMQGDCTSSGNALPAGGACAASQDATLIGGNGTQGTTTDGYTAGQIGGGSSNPPLVIFCSNGHGTCQPTPPPAPVIVPSSKPSTVVEAGSGGTTFTWTDLATAGVTFECSTTGLPGSYSACTSGDANAQFANTATGQYSFYVRALDGSTPPNHSAADSWSWAVVDANVSITPLSSASEVGHSQSFTITTNAVPAGTTASLTSITPQFSATLDSESDDCATPTIGTNTASCTVTITNNSASTVTVTATAVWHFSDGTNYVDVTRSTSPGATAQFVDASIVLSPLVQHVSLHSSVPMSCTITQNDGTSAAVPAGTLCDWSVTQGPDAGQFGSCPTTVSGSCVFVVSNIGGGQDTVHASTPSGFAVDGVGLTRTTQPVVTTPANNADTSGDSTDAWINIP
jgi:hypothetical protein